MDGVVPEYNKYSDAKLDEHKQQTNALLKEYLEHLDATKLRAGLSDVMHISG